MNQALLDQAEAEWSLARDGRMAISNKAKWIKNWLKREGDKPRQPLVLGNFACGKCGRQWLTGYGLRACEALGHALGHVSKWQKGFAAKTDRHMELKGHLYKHGNGECLECRKEWNRKDKAKRALTMAGTMVGLG